VTTFYAQTMHAMREPCSQDLNDDTTTKVCNESFNECNLS